MHKPTLRVLNILLFLSDNKGANLSEIAENTDIPKSTISPILKTLCENDFLHINESNQYFIWKNAFKVGSTFLNTNNVMDILKAYMKDIVGECNEICQLGIYDNGDIFYIARVESKQPIKLISNVGKSVPAHATALGKAILGKFSEERIRDIYKDGLIPITSKTITDIDILIEQINEAKNKGYAYENEETNNDVECLAVPLRSKGEIFAALSISIPIYRSSDNKRESVINILLDYKRKIELDLESLNIDIIADKLI